MARYSESYMQEHCIEVYFLYGNKKMHVLTDGNFIPQQLNDRDVNRTIQQNVANFIPDEITLNDVEVEQSYLNSLSDFAVANIPFPEITVLLRMFAPMAQLGFYSYDCTEIFNNGRGKYVLVASPDFQRVHHIQDLETVIPHFDGIQIVEEDNGVIKSFIM